MKTLLIQVLIGVFVIFQSLAKEDMSGLLAGIEKNAFTMKVYQRQGKMVAVHLANKTESDRISIKIQDKKGHLLHSEQITGSNVYVKKFDLSALKCEGIKVIIDHEGANYEAEVDIKEIKPNIEVFQRPKSIVAIQTSNSYGKKIGIYVTNAKTGEELVRKQMVSPGKSVSKFDFSKIDAEKINVKVVVGKEMLSKDIALL